MKKRTDKDNLTGSPKRVRAHETTPGNDVVVPPPNIPYRSSTLIPGSTFDAFSPANPYSVPEGVDVPASAALSPAAAYMPAYPELDDPEPAEEGVKSEPVAGSGGGHSRGPLPPSPLHFDASTAASNPGPPGAPPPELPSDWKWLVEEVAGNRARLPELGLPVMWAKGRGGTEGTESTHQKLAFDPVTKQTIVVDAGLIKRSPAAVGFITATRGHDEMPGTKAPASVRYTQFNSPEFQESLVYSARGDALVPCLVTGDYVKVESLEADHADAKSAIIARQKSLVQKLNDEPEFAAAVMALQGAEKFFIKVDFPRENGKETRSEYFGTLFFYELYFNDIDNIWLICGACNNHKSDKDMVKWLEGQDFYGPRFLETVMPIRHNGLIFKTCDGRGLAEAAVGWFWAEHARFARISKRIYENVFKPLDVMNREADKAGNDTVRGRRLGRSVSIKATLAALGIQIPTGRAPEPGTRSPSNGSDYIREIDGTAFDLSAEEHTEIERQLAERAPAVMADLVLEVTRAVVAAKEDRAAGPAEQAVSAGVSAVPPSHPATRPDFVVDGKETYGSDPASQDEHDADEPKPPTLGE